MNLKPLIESILKEYPLPWGGYHGVAHWGRVYENGMKLASKTGAKVEVVALFAVFHDSRRVNEGHDEEHGLRGAELAASQRNRFFELPDHYFRLLYKACEGHTHELTHPDVTIQTCWDADRLDLGRVGIVPHPSRLCTEAAKSKEMIDWAYGRGSMSVLPEVLKEWGIETLVQEGSQFGDREQVL
ncbi:MAG: hypothetical protein U0903_12980 [Planctomycetales bacterium]